MSPTGGSCSLHPVWRVCHYQSLGNDKGNHTRGFLSGEISNSVLVIKPLHVDMPELQQMQ